MHGARRVRQSREAQEAKQQRDQAKLTIYLTLSDDVLTRKKNDDWSKEALDVTSRMLSINPEYYTVWNYRRNILLNGMFPNRCASRYVLDLLFMISLHGIRWIMHSPPQEINEILTNDLAMTTIALKAHPKVYWIWNHRRWCLQNIPDGGDGDDPIEWKKTSWQREMGLVEKMLEADSRNFHAWNYRRYVLAGMPVRWPETAELAFTTKKIESNFSNFSAWHQRTKVLSSLWASGKLNRAATLQQEFDLVQNAMYTDPNDQSVWLYHRWLIGDGDDHNLLEREIVVIQELLDEQPDSKWCMESLVHYKQLQLRHHSSAIGEEGPQRLIRECIGLLDQLKSIDPQRHKRYEHLAEQVSHPR